MEQTTSFQDSQQDFQVFDTEYSLNLHIPNVSIKIIHSSPAVHNDQAFTEFVNGEERCLKFVNQDLTFLQASHILLTFSNVSHVPTQLKESLCITLPTHISTEDNNTSCTQIVEPALGFTLIEIHHAQNEPKLTVPQLLQIESCKDYIKTPLQTLDGIYVTQPERFLSLAQEVKKLAEEFWKEEIPSQWAGLPPEKLLQESFIEQLDALQGLDQLAPLTAAKEHLPSNIINILELLGKADNIPFNQRYNLAEDCTDRYYTKVIKTLICLLKNSFHDRQLVLVNTARALKFLESYVAWQAKLWKVFSKYHNLPDHFHDPKTTLQAEFDLLKKATSKNIQNIQEMVQSQQAYTTALFGHINTLYTKLAQLDKQVQIHCPYPHPQLDVIQLNAPDYNLDIDRELDPATDIQPLNAESAKENTPTDTSKPEDLTAIPPTTNRPEHQPSEVSADTDHTEYHSSEQPRAEHPSDYCPQLEDIPELETDEENWDNGQFDDVELLNHHNSTEESDRICCEYSAYFEKVKGQEYSPYHTTQGIE